MSTSINELIFCYTLLTTLKVSNSSTSNYCVLRTFRSELLANISTLNKKNLVKLRFTSLLQGLQRSKQNDEKKCYSSFVHSPPSIKYIANRPAEMPISTHSLLPLLYLMSVSECLVSLRHLS